MLVRNSRPTLLGSDVKGIMGISSRWCMQQHTSFTAFPHHKSPHAPYLLLFQSQAAIHKRFPGSSMLDPCRVPSHSTFNKCVWVILLFTPCCTRMSPSAPVPLKYILYTKSHRHVLALEVLEARNSAFQWGKWSPPIRNSFLQHQGTMEVTM